MFFRNLAEKIRRNSFSSIRTLITSIYTVIIIFFVVVTGVLCFTLASQQVEENALKNTQDMLTVKEDYLEKTLTDVFHQLVLLSNDLDVYYLIRSPEDVPSSMYIDLDKKINEIYYRYSDILESIYFDINFGQHTFYISPQQRLNHDFSYESYFDNLLGSKESYYWVNIHEDEIFLENQEVFSIIKLFGNQNSQVRGIMVFNLKRDLFQEVLEESTFTDNSYLFLITPNGSFLPEKVSEAFAIEQENLQTLMTGHQSENGHMIVKNNFSEELIVNYRTLGITGDWKIVSVTPKSDLTYKINQISMLTTVLILVILFIAILLVRIVGNYISSPINNMAKQIENINGENVILDYKSSVPKEMEILYNSFNDLMGRNQLLLEEVQMEQEEKRQLEIDVLQAQINPHFLYNTLYSIKSLCDMGMNEEASKMTSALSNFFRISLSDGKDIITIKEELEHISSYFYIMEMRYGDQFSYEIVVDPSLHTYTIPKLTLQPLVENAIYHGIRNLHRKGFIQVRGYLKNDLIHLEVMDDGAGMKQNQLKKINEVLQNHGNNQDKRIIGIGLKSVDVRIKASFGKQYGLSIESESGVGSRVSIVFPKSKR